VCCTVISQRLHVMLLDLSCPVSCQTQDLHRPTLVWAKRCTWENMYMIKCKILNRLQGYNQEYSLYVCNRDCWVHLSRPKTVQTFCIGRGLTMYIFLCLVFEAYCNIREQIFIYCMSRCSLWRTGHKILAVSYGLKSESFWLYGNM